MLEVALIGDVYGEESARNRHYYGDYECVPRHIEYVSYIFKCEVGKYYVYYIEHCVRCYVAEDDTEYEGHDRHTQTAQEVNCSYVCFCCTHRLDNIELFLSLEVEEDLREEPDDR